MTGRAPALRTRATGAEVEVRLVPLDVPASELRAARARLTPAELRYADSAVPAVRDRRVLLRAALRDLAGELLGLSSAEVPLTAPPGRPALTGASTGRLDLGCSASGRLGIVVAGGGRIGVDLEVVPPVGDLAAEQWLTAAERTALGALPAAGQPAALARCWTQKEAVLKGIGTGLRTDPATIETTGIDTTRPGSWALHPLDVPDGWVASLAVRRDGRSALTATGPRTA